MSFDRQSELLAVIQETSEHLPRPAYAQLHRAFALSDAVGVRSGPIAFPCRFEQRIVGNALFRGMIRGGLWDGSGLFERD